MVRDGVFASRIRSRAALLVFMRAGEVTHADGVSVPFYAVLFALSPRVTS